MKDLINRKQNKKENDILKTIERMINKHNE